MSVQVFVCGPLCECLSGVKEEVHSCILFYPSKHLVHFICRKCEIDWIEIQLVFDLHDAQNKIEHKKPDHTNQKRDNLFSPFDF